MYMYVYCFPIGMAKNKTEAGTNEIEKKITPFTLTRIYKKNILVYIYFHYGHTESK